MAALITSTSNQTVRLIRSLSQRKHRAETGLFFVEGIRLTAEAVLTHAPLDRLIVAPELLTSSYGREIAAQAESHGVEVIEVSAAVFRALSEKDGPQGLGALVRQRWCRLDDLPINSLCSVALDNTQDPGNIGTVIRTCDAVGAGALILLGDTADPYDPSAVRASMGALFATCLARANWPDFLAWVRAGSQLLVGTSDRAPHHYRASRYGRPLTLLMGSEQKGLTEGQQAACSLVVHLPMRGRSDSLNLAVATGVMLYEILSQHDNGGGP